jgi:hypothetical protein
MTGSMKILAAIVTLSIAAGARSQPAPRETVITGVTVIDVAAGKFADMVLLDPSTIGLERTLYVSLVASIGIENASAYTFAFNLAASATSTDKTRVQFRGFRHQHRQNSRSISWLPPSAPTKFAFNLVASAISTDKTHVQSRGFRL